MYRWRRNPIPKFRCKICGQIFPADEMDYIQDFDPDTLTVKRILVCNDCEVQHKQEKYESNPYRRNSDAQMRRLEREYNVTGDPDVLDQIRVMQRRTQQMTSAGPQAHKYGDAGVDVKLNAPARNTPLLFWSPVNHNSYVLVDHYSSPNIWGDFWEHPVYGDVDVISINGHGEIRWQVEPWSRDHLSQDDRSAAAYFGFLGGDPCGICKGAGRTLPHQHAMPYESIMCNTCGGTGLEPE